MEWPFIRKTRIAKQIADAIKKEKAKGEIITLKKVAEKEERLEFRHRMSIAEKDAEIIELESEISNIQNRTKGVERVHNKNSKRASEQQRIISSFSVASKRLVITMGEEYGKIQQILHEADILIKNLQKKETSEIKALGHSVNVFTVKK